MMRQEMPQKYWKHLPETRQLPTLLREAGQRVQAMAERDAQAPAKPRMVRRALPAADAAAPVETLAALRARASQCRACPLWEPATQTVFGEGPPDARIVVVGEQPGDQEDLRGRPFVGPAGQLLDRALAELGADRAQLYLTNAVKHFKFTRLGKVRLHAKANVHEQQACRPWLAAELEAIAPARIVCLGATAAQAVFGPGFALMRERGRVHQLPDGREAVATVHPSWVLRQDDDRELAYRGFVEDLAVALEGNRARKPQV
jgi:DNA polymerase